MKPFAVLIFGPPGSGKTTQAEWLAHEFDAVHMDTGAILRKISEDPRWQDDPDVQAARTRATEGDIADSDWVADIMLSEIKKLAGQGKSQVFSGSPRRAIEAQKEIPVLTQLYPGRVFLVKLEVNKAESLKRNQMRGRVDDDPEIIKRRLRLYHEESEPVLQFCENDGVPIIAIDGEPSPDVVFESLKNELGKRL